MVRFVAQSDEQIIELSPEFNIDIDVEDMLKDLKPRHGDMEIHEDLRCRLYR